MMKSWKNIVKFARVSFLVVIAGFGGSTRCDGVAELPEIAILKQLEDVRYSDEKMVALLESAQFLDDEQAVINLLDHLRQLDCRDRKNFDTLILYRIVLSYMSCHPERLIIERLHAETDVWEKTKLIDLLRAFHQPEVFVALVEQFEDSRKIRCEHCWRQRICEHAYTDFVGKLEQFDFVEYRHFRGVFGAVPSDGGHPIKKWLVYPLHAKPLMNYTEVKTLNPDTISASDSVHWGIRYLYAKRSISKYDFWYVDKEKKVECTKCTKIDAPPDCCTGKLYDPVWYDVEQTLQHYNSDADEDNATYASSILALYHRGKTPHDKANIQYLWPIMTDQSARQ